MRMCVVVLMSTFLMAITFAESSYAQSAQDLLSNCRDIAEKAKINGDRVIFPTNFGTGYCWGVFQTIQGLSVHTEASGARRLLNICPPPESTTAQFVSIFVKYAQDNPEQLHQDCTEVAMRALYNVFPCNTQLKKW